MESDNNTENEQVESEVDDEKDTSWSEKEESGADDQEKKKYKCTEPGCNARFLRPSRLERHLRKHNDERPFKCRQSGCTRAYTNSSHLKRHEDTHKNIVKIYECKECLQELRSYASLKRHYKMIHDPQRLRCGMCGAKFRKKHCYDDHMSMHTGVAKYKCEICKAECATLRQFKKHQIIHRKTYRCKSEGCNEVFDNWSKMRKHVTTDHQYAHNCPHCDKKFTFKMHLQKHMMFHESSDHLAACPYPNCAKFYTVQRNLDAHIHVVHLGRRYHCDTCGDALTSKATLVRHIKRVHESPNPAPKIRKKPRKRKDAGIHKRSVAVKLAGLELPYELEKRIVNRKPTIDEKKNEKRVKKIVPVVEPRDLIPEVIIGNDSPEGSAAGTSQAPDMVEIVDLEKFGKSKLQHIQTILVGKRYYCDMCQKPFTKKLTLISHIKTVHGRQKKIPKHEICKVPRIRKGGESSELRKNDQKNPSDPLKVVEPLEEIHEKSCFPSPKSKSSLKDILPRVRVRKRRKISSSSSSSSESMEISDIPDNDDAPSEDNFSESGTTLLKSPEEKKSPNFQSSTENISNEIPTTNSPQNRQTFGENPKNSAFEESKASSCSQLPVPQIVSQSEEEISISARSLLEEGKLLVLENPLEDPLETEQQNNEIACFADDLLSVDPEVILNNSTTIPDQTHILPLEEFDINELEFVDNHFEKPHRICEVIHSENVLIKDLPQMKEKLTL